MVMEEQESDMELASERVPVPQVQKAAEECHVEPFNKVTSSSRGKPRLRKKALHAAILKQMEFYFSDANLAKDRFLRNLIEEDSYVDLNVFIRFNRIRELTTDTSRIAKALSGSDVLQLSDDGTKVQRITPIAQKENIDDCTVYVQNLPTDTDHEILQSIFSQYGHVVYVSVPKYKSNKKIKGFAFVEFDKPEYARKCLKAFQKKGCMLPSNTAPDDLLSITTFDNTEKDVTQYARLVATNEIDDSTQTTNNVQSNVADIVPTNSETKEEHKYPKKVRKRKHNENSISEADESEVCHGLESKEDVANEKKIKCGSKDDEQTAENALVNNNEQDVTATESSEEPQSKKRRASKVEIENNKLDSSQNNELKETEDADMVSDNDEGKTKSKDKKKKRKRKRNNKVEDDCYTMGLQVMAKKDWKTLRNKYLDLQRSKMKQLKQHLRKTRWNQWSNMERCKPEKEENNDKATKQDSSGGQRYSFAPGVIVKIEFDKPCSDPKNFKMELRGNNAVKYIDVDEGSFHAYIRCDSTEAAQSFAQKSTEERQMSILQDEEEKMYWDKIAQDREEKLGKKIRVKQRGRNKLLKKAEKELGKHIKFDDEV